MLMLKLSGPPQQQVFEGKRHDVQPQNGIPGFSWHFLKELSYGYLRFEGVFLFPSKLRYLTIFPTNFAMATLVLKEIGKLLQT